MRCAFFEHGPGPAGTARAGHFTPATRTNPSVWAWFLIAAWLVTTGGGFWLLNPNPFGVTICRVIEPS